MEPTMKAQISAVIITFNEEARIERCLRSLDWVDEIIVVDSFSTDRTVELCRRYTDKVYQHPWPNSYARQRTIASQYAAHEWHLSLDADEVVTKALRDEIIEAVNASPDIAAFRIPRREYFAGKWIKAGGWYPQYKTILFRRSSGAWEKPIHEEFIVQGKQSPLKNPILHDGYGDFKLFMQKFNHYSSLEAERNFTTHHPRSVNLWKALFKPLERFYGRFIRHRGYRDGIHGFYMAAVIAINYFLTEMKVYELICQEEGKRDWDVEYRRSAVGADAEGK